MAGGGVTGALLYAVTSAVLGMLQFGYNSGVINAPQEFIEAFIQQSYDTNANTAQTLFAVAVSLFPVGGVLGCPCGSWLAEKRGRKGALVLNTALGVIAALLMGFSKISSSYNMLATGRFIIGFNCGFATTVAPMYVSEIAPINLRGAIGTVNQLAFTIGLVGGQILGIDRMFGSANGWPWLLGFTVIPSALQFMMLPFAPESPRYLMIAQHDEQSARGALAKLRGEKDVDDEIEEMHAEDSAMREAESFTALDLLKSPELRMPLLIGIVTHLSQPLGGINAVLYYSTSIFVQAGLEPSYARVSTIGVGLVLVAMALVAIPLMDRLGRRTLQLIGLGGMAVFSILMTVALSTYENNATMSAFAVVFTLGYVAFFGVGPGSTPFLVMAELFGQGPRSAAVSVGAMANWSANFLVGLSFLPLVNLLNQYAFVPFTVFLILFFVFTFFKLPETKNKTIEEITALFRSW